MESLAIIGNVVLCQGSYPLSRRRNLSSQDPESFPNVMVLPRQKPVTRKVIQYQKIDPPEVAFRGRSRVVVLLHKLMISSVECNFRPPPLLRFLFLPPLPPPASSFRFCPSFFFFFPFFPFGLFLSFSSPWYKLRGLVDRTLKIKYVLIFFFLCCIPFSFGRVDWLINWLL